MCQGFCVIESSINSIGEKFNLVSVSVVRQLSVPKTSSGVVTKTSTAERRLQLHLLRAEGGEETESDKDDMENETEHWRPVIPGMDSSLDTRASARRRLNTQDQP